MSRRLQGLPWTNTPNNTVLLIWAPERLSRISDKFEGRSLSSSCNSLQGIVHSSVLIPDSTVISPILQQKSPAQDQTTALLTNPHYSTSPDCQLHHHNSPSQYSNRTVQEPHFHLQVLDYVPSFLKTPGTLAAPKMAATDSESDPIFV